MKNLPLSEEQNRLYDILGMLILNIFKTCYDFSLNTLGRNMHFKKEEYFVDALELLGYLIQVEEGRYL